MNMRRPRSRLLLKSKELAEKTIIKANDIGYTKVTRISDISEDGKYCWSIYRGLSSFKKTNKGILWISLHPSIEDPSVDTLTIKYLINQSARWDFEHIWICNLFPLRVKQLRDIDLDPDCINFEKIIEIIPKVEVIICSWGIYGVYRDIDLEFLSELEYYINEELELDEKPKLKCLALNRNGTPLQVPNLSYREFKDIEDYSFDIAISMRHLGRIRSPRSNEDDITMTDTDYIDEV